jgi:hypothetical protein
MPDWAKPLKVSSRGWPRAPATPPKDVTARSPKSRKSLTRHAAPGRGRSASALPHGADKRRGEQHRATGTIPGTATSSCRRVRKATGLPLGIGRVAARSREHAAETGGARMGRGDDSGVLAAALDRDSGELRVQRLPWRSEEMAAFAAALPGAGAGDL